MVTRGSAGREWVVHESQRRVHRQAAAAPDPVDGLWTTPQTACQSSLRMTPMSFPWMRTSS
jgi:hypothetical protein